MRTTQQCIDDLNFYNDSRNDRVVPVPADLPTCWAICGRCEGDGTMVNPAIDAGGLSADLSDDPDFMGQYMSGAFDIACNGCGGSGKVREIDRDREDFADQIAEYDADVEAQYESDAEHRAEMIMGC